LCSVSQSCLYHYLVIHKWGCLLTHQLCLNPPQGYLSYWIITFEIMSNRGHICVRDTYLPGLPYSPEGTILLSSLFFNSDQKEQICLSESICTHLVIAATFWSFLPTSGYCCQLLVIATNFWSFLSLSLTVIAVAYCYRCRLLL
jgi:hypothetical protein